MNTEKHIVYEILNIVKNHEHNNDEPVTERLMRGYLKTFRPDMIRKYYKNGINVTDECSQTLVLTPDKKGTEYQVEIPKIIRMDFGSGMSISFGGLMVPIVDLEQYELSKLNPFGSRNIQAKAVGQKLTLFTPKIDECMNVNKPLFNVLVGIEKGNVPDVIIQAILTDPSDDPNYDWENDIYPFPSEKEHELVAQIIRQVFGISTQMKKDEIQNGRADNIIYQDEFNINGGN